MKVYKIFGKYIYINDFNPIIQKIKEYILCDLLHIHKWETTILREWLWEKRKMRIELYIFCDYCYKTKRKALIVEIEE